MYNPYAPTHMQGIDGLATVLVKHKKTILIGAGVVAAVAAAFGIYKAVSKKPKATASASAQPKTESQKKTTTVTI